MSRAASNLDSNPPPPPGSVHGESSFSHLPTGILAGRGKKPIGALHRCPTWSLSLQIRNQIPPDSLWPSSLSLSPQRTTSMLGPSLECSRTLVTVLGESEVSTSQADCGKVLISSPGWDEEDSADTRRSWSHELDHIFQERSSGQMDDKRSQTGPNMCCAALKSLWCHFD